MKGSVGELAIVGGVALSSVFTFMGVLAVTNFLVSDIGTRAMTNNMALRGDVLASSMDVLHMHSDVAINMSWDYTPFAMYTTEGALLMMYYQNHTTVSPYPLIVAPEEAKDGQRGKYVVGNEVMGFEFSNEDGPRMVVK